jgi:hypothetical protein
VAREFLLARGITGDDAQTVWNGIALHTTPEIPLHMRPEIALVTRGVELDALGIGHDAVTDAQRDAVVAAHPRPDFKNQILAAFTDGIKDRPETTFGNVEADVLVHFAPGFVRGDFVEVIRGSHWPEQCRCAGDSSRPRALFDMPPGGCVSRGRESRTHRDSASAQAELGGASRPGAPALGREDPLGHGDLVLTARVVRGALATESGPCRRGELQATGETVAGVDGPVAGALTVSEPVPSGRRYSVRGSGGDQRDTDRHGACRRQAQEPAGREEAASRSHAVFAPSAPPRIRAEASPAWR